MDDESRLVGFIGLYPTRASNGYAGAAMVTDIRGFPLEFRVTEAVRPTLVQRSLYGSSLEPYIEAHLIATPLIEDLKRVPSVIVVNRSGMVQAQSSTPLVHITAGATVFELEDNSMQSRRFPSRTAPEGFQTLVAASHHSDALDGCAELLTECSQYFNLEEVFERMSNALAVVAESDDRYR